MRLIRSVNGFDIKVDDAKYEWLSQYSWFVTKGTTKKPSPPYATTTISMPRLASGKVATLVVKMHHMVIPPPKEGNVTDHKNGDGLDNQEDNLRTCTRLQNAKNRAPNIGAKSGYKGVQQHYHKWRAEIKHDRVTYQLGSFYNKWDAVNAYEEKAKELFGEFYRPQIIPEMVPAALG